jgi:hypothetical protein
MNLKLVLEEFQDHLAPRLDTYEQALYVYVFRHSRLQGLDEVVIGFKSARRHLAFGIGEKGKPMSEATCYEKLRGLEAKGAIKVLGTERGGTRIKLFLPSEIPGLVPPEEAAAALSLEETDFFSVPENRKLILKREGHKCFYCLRALRPNNHVIEHVVSRPAGGNSYRNVVAACLACNNRKGEASAEEFLRTLYRQGLLGPQEFESRAQALVALREGRLRPQA